MLALSSSFLVQKIEKRCSQRLAHQNDTNAANVKSTTKAMNKAEMAKKKKKERKRQTREGEMKPSQADH